MKVTISKAAELTGISRQHLYRKYINTGELSTIKEYDKNLIEISELLRIFPNIKMDNVSPMRHEMLHNVTSKCDSVTLQETEIVTLIKAQLAEAKEREKWLIRQIEELRQQQSLFLEDKVKKRKKIWGIF